MKAVILAGGRGERLKPLTDKIPKPMVTVADKPILQHIIELLKKEGINQFIFALCYKGQIIKDFFGDGSKFGAKIDYVWEDENQPKGTAGAVLQSQPYINETFIVTSGDILRELDINKMIKYHKTKKSFATLNIYKREGNDAKSVVKFSEDNELISFLERPNQEQILEDFVWSNGSFYIFEKDIFKFIDNNNPTDFGKDIFPKLVNSEKRITVFPTENYFLDIGNLDKLKKAHEYIKNL